MNDQAVVAFIERKAEIDRMLDALTELSTSHFNVSPDELNWGHVGSLGLMSSKLAEICEFSSVKIPAHVWGSPADYAIEEVAA